MAGRLQDKVAIVSGAGSGGPGWGNGKATAVAFAREGARVFAVDLNPEAAAETVSIIAEEGGVSEAHAADVSDPKAVEEMVEACCAAFGGVDVLHNNVGIGGMGGPVETPLERWETVMRVNVTSVFLTCKFVIPVMLERGGGSIINVSSLSATKVVRAESAYAASKGAINSFTANLAVEYASRGIRCNAIVPGLINTPMVANMLSEQLSPADVEANMQARDRLSPTGKMGEAWDVAHAAVFLASDEAKYVNGLLLNVDGGLQNKFAP
jgi:NAD(P)-dependent dehydrogenase (short-subunit alcohol dehydrogenase family)